VNWSIPPTSEAEKQLRFWCEQTISCALTLRAAELQKVGVDPDFMDEARKTCIEIAEKIFTEIGPVQSHEHQSAWMAAIADGTFRWVNQYLDRD